MGFALFFNIIAVILSTVASIVLIIFVIALSEVFDYENGVSSNCQPDDASPDRCVCKYDDSNINYDSCKFIQKENRFDETKKVCC